MLDWSEKQKQDTIEVGLRKRGPYDELIKEFRSGYAFTFDILMDIGGWRDMHRHRRCQQVQQNFTTIHGYDVPRVLGEAGLERDYRSAMDAVKSDIEQLRKASQEAALYAIPFGFKVRCLFKMDYAEAEYLSKLRSGVKGPRRAPAADDERRRMPTPGRPDDLVGAAVQLVRRLRALGPLWWPDVPAVTSARRWQRRGVLRTSALNLALMALYHAGVSPATLCRIYHGRAPVPPDGEGSS